MTAYALARPAIGDKRLPAAAVVAGGGLALVAIGALVPWMSLYAGLAPIAGYQLDGGPLAGIAVAAAGLLVVSARLGGGRVLRLVGAVAGLAVAADAIYATARIDAFVADPGPAGALTQPTIGVGAPVMAIGGLAIAAAALMLRPRARAITRDDGLRLLVAGALLLSGWIHLLLAPSHFAESAALGSGFVLAGIAQAVLAAWLVLARSDAPMVATVGVTAALLALYAWAVAIGLPVGSLAHEAHEAEGGLRILAGEPVDLAGAVNAVAEAAALLIALAALGRTSPVDRATVGD